MERDDQEPGPAPRHEDMRISHDDNVLGVFGLFAGIVIVVALVVVVLANLLD